MLQFGNGILKCKMVVLCFLTVKAMLQCEIAKALQCGVLVVARFKLFRVHEVKVVQRVGEEVLIFV